MKNNKGFSLVELIIVVAIMAVLMGILAPQYIRYVEKTRIRADDSIVSEVDKSAQATLADEKFYTKVSGTVVTITFTNNTGAISVAGLDSSVVTDFVNEIYASVYGKNQAVDNHKSKGYGAAGSTTLKYEWDGSLYTWKDASITNSVKDSKYYQATTTTTT